jgi:response regulator RpfG family c-di-GMP phosphodiesterase
LGLDQARRLKDLEQENARLKRLLADAMLDNAMLKDVESPWPLAEIVHQHHERMDGSGYPRNLKGDDILIEARILSVADVVEAMASHTPIIATDIAVEGLGVKNHEHVFSSD